jgi:hypothetical protein
MVLWIIFEALSEASMTLLLWLRMFLAACFLVLVVYTSTDHYRKYFESVTLTVMLFVIILKFVVTVSFA